MHPQSRITEQFIHDVRVTTRADVRDDIATKQIFATDNSIWQVQPSAIIAPRSASDVVKIVRLLAEERYRTIALTPRGGGTSTAGQTLTDGVVLDCKRHLNNIGAYDPESKTIEVEPGVVLSTINAHLKQFGVMFGPTVATATRATIGGMIGNDSAGKGSARYGKTSGSIKDLSMVLPNGSTYNTSDACGFDATLQSICVSVHDELAKHWPTLPRYVSGYNLPMTWNGEKYQPQYLFCGAEGTLGIVTSATLQCVEIPTGNSLLIVALHSISDAYRCGNALRNHKPNAIEFIDDKVLTLAKSHFGDSVVSSLIGHSSSEIKGVLFVDVSSNNPQRVKELLDEVKQFSPVHTKLVEDETEMNEAWALRSKCVGLLSSTPSDARPIPFVEDCAVPPEVLPEFTKAFIELLNKHHLDAGMFGHVDAGVLHIRPALNMKNSTQRQLAVQVTHEVSELVHSFGGVLWGEHGKGFRSEFSQSMFGKNIWNAMCRVKRLFDPHNQFNPGKVAVPELSIPLKTMNEPTRGEFNASISHNSVIDYVQRCDGNSDCQSASMHDSMCPTFRATNDPVHSPRGRAELLRHWLRSPSKEQEMVVHEALDGCITCKACSTHCPVGIDIPAMKSEYLHQYYLSRNRPFKEKLLAALERSLPLLSNRLLQRVPIKFLSRAFGIVDVPTHVPTPDKLKEHEVSVDEINTDIPSVVIVLDALTRQFRPTVVVSLINIIDALGLEVFVVPLRDSGKVQHSLGMKQEFKNIARNNINLFKRFINSNVTLIGIEPAITLLWRGEYKTIFSDEGIPDVLLPQEWLVRQNLVQGKPREWTVLPHCHELNTQDKASLLWEEVFQKLGQQCEVMQASCCGMSGFHGHLKQHQSLTKQVWDSHWGTLQISANETLATGLSCHTQVSRFANVSLKHPLEVIESTISLETQQTASTPALV